MTGNWEIFQKYDRWVAIERGTEEMLVAPTRHELEEIIKALDE